jgi:drug/metabolite transporter (DMT)-like permease
MRTPFLSDISPDEPLATQLRPAYMAWLSVLLCILAAVAFVVGAIRVPNIVAASMLMTAAIVSLGAGLILGLSMWVFPELPR